MSKKHKKSKKSDPVVNQTNLKAVRAEKMKIGKIQLLILFTMIIAALVFVIPRINS